MQLSQHRPGGHAEESVSLLLQLRVTRTLVARGVVKILVRDNSPTVPCQYPLPHLWVDTLLLVCSVFIKLFPTIHGKNSWAAVVATITFLGT